MRKAIFLKIHHEEIYGDCKKIKSKFYNHARIKDCFRLGLMKIYLQLCAGWMLKVECPGWCWRLEVSSSPSSCCTVIQVRCPSCTENLLQIGQSHQMTCGHPPPSTPTWYRITQVCADVNPCSRSLLQMERNSITTQSMRSCITKEACKNQLVWMKMYKILSCPCKQACTRRGGANKGSWGTSFRGKVSICPRNSKLTCGINESKGQKKRGALCIFRDEKSHQ